MSCDICDDKISMIKKVLCAHTLTYHKVRVSMKKESGAI